MKKEIKDLFLKIFGFNIQYYIQTIEERFFIRFFIIYKFSTNIERTHLDDIMILHQNSTDRYEFLNFYKNFITSSFSENYFENSKPVIKEKMNENFNIIFLNLIYEFNKFRTNYFESIKMVFTDVYGTYFYLVRRLFYTKNLSETQNNMKIWVADLFNNETNSILLLIFPELTLFIDKIKNQLGFKYNYKKIHYFFSLVIFKFTLRLPFIKSDFLKQKNNDSFLITDSKNFNFLTLEMGCFMSFFAFLLINDQSSFKYLTLKSFISFIRLKNPNFLKFSLLHEYCNLNNFDKIDDMIELNENYLLYYFTSRNFARLEHIKNIKIIQMKKDLFNREYGDLTVLEKLNKTYLTFNTNKHNYVDFFNKNREITKRITNIFLDWFYK